MIPKGPISHNNIFIILLIESCSSEFTILNFLASSANCDEYVSFPSYVLKDYLERYLPTYFSNEYKFYSYNETLKYSLKHSIL